jgi:hypothetical protein
MKPSNYSILFILSLFLAACSNPPGNPLNQEASFPASFDLTKMGLKVITSSINKKQATMSTLYGNAAALKAATDSTQHQPGETYALVTWKQKADGHWFGANIPGDLQSVTMLKTTGQTGAITFNYQKYTGKNLTLSADTVGNKASMKFILSERASVMP